MNNDFTQVSPSDAGDIIQVLLSAGVPVMLWGSPGIGKSDLVRQIADAAAMPLIDIRVSQLEPVDARGLPHINDGGETTWAVPAMLPQSRRDGKAGILFLDELTAGNASVMAAFYQLILDRRLGDYKLPDGWRIIAASNLRTDRSISNTMPMALANRFGHLTMVPDASDWVSWAYGSGRIREEIIGFIRMRPDLLYTFDPTPKPGRKQPELTFASPRTWEFCSRTLEASPPAHCRISTFAANVGQGPAIEFDSFLRVWSTMQSIDGIILNPDSADIPSDPAALYALATALAHRATDQNLSAIWRYLKRLPQREFCVYAMQGATRRDKSLEKTRAFSEFGVEYADELS